MFIQRGRTGQKVSWECFLEQVVMFDSRHQSAKNKKGITNSKSEKLKTESEICRESFSETHLRTRVEKLPEKHVCQFGYPWM